MPKLKPTRARTDHGMPLVLVARHARRVSQFCDLLETLADDLPRKAMPVWREVHRLCNTVIPMHYEDVASVLVPVLIRRSKGNADCEDVLNRLRLDYDDGRVRIPELAEILTDAMCSDGPKIEPDALGFALRSYFEAMRRQSDWELDVLLPLARRKLTQEDLEEIALQLMEHDTETFLVASNVSASGKA